MRYNLNNLQHMVDFKAKIKDSSNKVTVEREVFIGSSNYYNPAIAFNINDNTAKRILEFIAATISNGQTSIMLEVKALMKILSIKDDKTIRNAIKALIENYCLFRWKDIITEENVVKPNRNWYLLNPLVVRNISVERWNKEVDVTCYNFNNTKGYVISEYSALELEEFHNINIEINKCGTNEPNRNVSIAINKTCRGIKN